MNLFAQQSPFGALPTAVIIVTILILLFGLIVLAVFAHYFRFWIHR